MTLAHLHCIIKNNTDDLSKLKVKIGELNVKVTEKIINDRPTLTHLVGLHLRRIYRALRFLLACGVIKITMMF